MLGSCRNSYEEKIHVCIFPYNVDINLFYDSYMIMNVVAAVLFFS